MISEQTFEYERQEKYQKPIDYETILGHQMSRIAQYRSNKERELYEESVDTLLIMLPKNLRDKALSFKQQEHIYYDMSEAGKIKYDTLWIQINEALEEHNLIYKTSYLKTYS